MIPTNNTPPTKLARHLAGEFATRAGEADIEGRLPDEDVRLLKESGYLTLSIPREYGGYGLSLRDCAAAHLELAQGSASTAMVAGMPIHLFGHQSQVRLWPEEKFAWFCEEVVQKGAIFNAAASEPQMGSPSRGGLPTSTAVEHPDGWLVNGHKTWTTGGKHLTHMLVQVRIEDDPANVLVTRDMPGVSWKETWRNALSLRASDSHDVFYQDVIAPPSHLISRGKQPGPSLPSAWFPVIMTTVYLGSALAARDALIRFALERVPTALGKPIATLPKIQRQIGEIDLALQAAQALLLQAAGDWTGDPDHWNKQFPHIVTAKHFAIEVANDVTDKALQVAGGQGITKALPLERFFRDVRAGRMQPPSGDTALEIIGRHAIEQVNGALSPIPPGE
jgi:alkylation response protein AidB-like acyl-CoA dehydrogenase